MKLKFNDILTLIYLIYFSVGLIGFLSPWERQFQELSFLNLILTFCFLALSFKNEWQNFMKLIFIISGIGFTAELIGVHTNLLFGNYHYENQLGPKILAVPLIIGINWAIISIGAWKITLFFTQNTKFRILLGSIFLVLFDIAMEPVAITFDYWQWQHDVIPMYNYISWFLVSIIALTICSKIELKQTGLSKIILLTQFALFLILNIKFYVN